MSKAEEQPPDPAAARATTAPGPASLFGGRFDLLAEIGSGSSGTVHRARLRTAYRHLPAGAEVAVKFLRKELVADASARERLRAEGELGQTIDHPNVAAIHGVETIEVLGAEVTYLVMQYVAGTTLRHFVRGSGAPVEDLTRRIGAGAAAGLFALHRRGLVHRDVKPENLILTPDSQLKIVDLGHVRPFAAGGPGGSPSGSSDGGSSASAAARSSGGQGFAGSIAYAAPETLRGGPASPRGDLYALGIVLFEVATGRHPFARFATADEMLHAQLHVEPPRPSHLRAHVSPFLEQVLLDLLQKDPDRRPRDAAEVQRVLEQGEHSEYWRRHESRAPALASARRLLRMRRPADAPFCGRAAELAALDAALAGARAGRGGAVAVSGPEGAGRRRLLDEAMARWLEGPEPPGYLGGDADRGLGHAEPFASAVLDWLLRGDGRDSPNAGPRAANAARGSLQLSEADAEALAAVTLGTSTELPEVRADRLATALLQLARPGRVLVLRIDHADKLDTSGRLVLQRLLASAGRRHLLLLLVAGADAIPGDPGPRLDLQGLAERDFLAFGAALFRDGAVAEGFLLEAHQVLSGVPGNLIEALEHLVQEGQLHGRAGDYHELAPDARVRPAPGLLARFHRRIAGLAPAQRAVLEAAAVLGERCQLDELAALAGTPELAVLETLSLFRGRIVRAEAGEVSFRHRDFQMAVLNTIPAHRRRDLHLRAAADLEAGGRSPLEVGMHRSQALDHEGCLLPLLDGLEARVAAGSRRTALRVVGRLAVHFAQVPRTEQNERHRARYLLLAARARTNAGQHEAAARTFRAAEALAHSLGAMELSAAARTGLAARELDAGRLLSAIALLEAVHDDLGQAAGDRAAALAARAHGLHGRILLYRGQAADGLRHLNQALARAPADQDDLRCHLLIDLARIEALQYHFPTALKTLQKVEHLPASRHLPRARLRLHLYRGQIRALLGDDGAAQDLRFARDEAERLALPDYAARATLLLGERQFWRRRDDEARQTFARAAALAVAGGDRLGEAMARCYLLRLGADDDGLESLVDALELPSVWLNWLLARCATAPLGPADAAAIEDLAANADLPLSLHLRALAALARPASARSIVRGIAERVPNRTARQRFLAEWSNGARM
ncbi:MAG: hypothetical protein FJ265_14205 [Planctomycetes bacterium]|nr:hypothetical protein [Planctomycetota bacterium]